MSFIFTEGPRVHKHGDEGMRLGVAQLLREEPRWALEAGGVGT